MDIKKIREISGLSQSQFSKKYRIPVKTIGNWEQGVRECPEYVLDLLEQYVLEDKKEKEFREKMDANITLEMTNDSDYRTIPEFKNRMVSYRKIWIYEEIPEKKAPKELREEGLKGSGAGITYGIYFKSNTAGEMYGKYYKRYVRHIAYAPKVFEQDEWLKRIKKTEGRIKVKDDEMKIRMKKCLDVYNWCDVEIYSNKDYDGENSIDERYDKYIEAYLKRYVFEMELRIKISEEDAVRLKRVAELRPEHLQKVVWKDLSARV